MTPYGELMTMNGNAMRTPLLCLLSFVFAERIPTRTLVILRARIRKEVVSVYVDIPPQEWDRVAESMMIRFGENGHPVFQATSPLSRGTL